MYHLRHRNGYNPQTSQLTYMWDFGSRCQTSRVMSDVKSHVRRQESCQQRISMIFIFSTDRQDICRILVCGCNEYIKYRDFIPRANWYQRHICGLGIVGQLDKMYVGYVFSRRDIDVKHRNYMSHVQLKTTCWILMFATKGQKICKEGVLWTWYTSYISQVYGTSQV